MRWTFFIHVLKISSCLSAKILKNQWSFSNVMTQMYCHLFMVHSVCMYNSYNSYHRYTCTVKMLYFLNSFQYIVRTNISYLRSKKLPVSGGFAPRSPHQGLCPGPRWEHSPRPHHLHPNTLLFPQPNQGRLDNTLLTDSSQSQQ